MISTFVFIFGTFIGSFLNVCIYRIPRKLSIVLPRSYCTKCETPIAWYNNIPLLSYLSLGAKCRSCHEKISPRYFLIEALTGILFLVFYRFFGLSPELFVYLVLVSGLIVATFIDFEFQIIPDRISLGGAILGLVVAYFLPHITLKDSFIGFLLGGGMIYLIGALGSIVFKKEAMGGGDVKFLAMIGSFIGWQQVLLVFFIAPFFGSIVGLYMKFKYKESLIPYGPFLSMAAVLVILYGDEILKWLIF